MAGNRRYSLGELADRLSLRLVGDGARVIHGIAPLRSAGPGQISFLSNPAYAGQLAATRASAVIVEERHALACPADALVSDAPYLSFARATALFAEAPLEDAGVAAAARVHPEARVADSARIGHGAVVEAGAAVGADSVVGPGCVVGRGAVIGAECVLHGNVVVYRGVTVGDRAIVHAGAVLGADGFGFASDGGRLVKVHQLGGVEIGDDVEIGAGTTIDRGTLDSTVIGRGVKIDNQVQIGHNTRIGEDTVVCGCVAIAGSVVVGRRCVLGGGSGVAGHLSIADGTRISAMSLVSRTIAEAGTYSSGTGQMRTAEWKRNITRFEQLDDIARRLRRLERQGGGPPRPDPGP